MTFSNILYKHGRMEFEMRGRVVANFAILQRWVGVRYHPETEIQSHYGEMAIG